MINENILLSLHCKTNKGVSKSDLKVRIKG